MTQNEQNCAHLGNSLREMLAASVGIGQIHICDLLTVSLVELVNVQIANGLDVRDALDHISGHLEAISESLSEGAPEGAQLH